MTKQGYFSGIWVMPSKKFMSLFGFALAALVYVVATIHVLHPRYIVNDNIINMDFIIAGYQLDYMGALFTALLHQIYVMQPGLPWYGLSLYTLHVLSVFMWLKLIWRAFHKWWLASVFSVLFFVYYATLLIELDYTSTSEMLCVSALVWACLDVLERRPGYLRHMGPGVVFMLGMLTRPQGILGAFACVLPLALMVATDGLRRHPPKEEVLRLVLIAMVFMTPALTNFAADTAYRHYTVTPQQASYDAFNRPRGMLHALSPERQGEMIRDRALLQSVHWEVGDAQNFFHWRFLDERIYTPTALETLVKNAPYAQHPYAGITDQIVSLMSAREMVLLLTCCIPFFLLAFPRHPWLAGTGLLLPLYCVLLDALLSVFLTFRSRTEFPFLLCFGFLTLIISGYLATRTDTSKNKTRTTSMIVGVLIAMTAILITWRPLMRTSAINLAHTLYMQNVLSALNHDYAGSIVLEQQNALQPEALNPLDTYQYYFHDIDMVWGTFSPYFYEQLKPLGIEHGYQLVDALVDNKNAYFLGNGWEANINIASYAHKPKGVVTKILIRHFVNPYELNLYRFVTEKAANQIR